MLRVRPVELLAGTAADGVPNSSDATTQAKRPMADICQPVRVSPAALVTARARVLLCAGRQESTQRAANA